MRAATMWAGTWLAVLLALGGCSEGGSDEMSAAAPARPQARELEPGAAGVGEGAAEQQGRDTPAQAPNLAVDQRAIVYTGSITVRVDDVNAAAARTTGIVAGVKGFVGGDQRNSDGGTGSSDATLTLRVPAASFTSVVDQLAGLGDEEKRAISTEDVTEETVDLDARIATQKARVDSGRRLLAQAKDLEDLVMLEREVATREADLASLEAKKRRLADLTALSTITLVLLDPETEAAAADDSGGFLGGLRTGWDGLLASLAVALTVLGFALPWLLLLGVPAVLVLRWARRRRARDLSPEPAPTPGS